MHGRHEKLLRQSMDDPELLDFFKESLGARLHDKGARIPSFLSVLIRVFFRFLFYDCLLFVFVCVARAVAADLTQKRLWSVHEIYAFLEFRFAVEFEISRMAWQTLRQVLCVSS